MAERKDRIGQLVGDYRLRRLVGRGGFGEVYQGEHIYTHQQAAIKILQLQLVEGREDWKEFLHEARTMHQLQHPHIIRLLDFGMEDGSAFLIMDYAPRGTMRDRYPKGTRLPLSAVLPYVMQIASALQYAHDRRLVHRDVKPENILLGENNEIYLSDFGIVTTSYSTNLETVREPLHAGGTLLYMAPEQLEKKARPASDQYALAMMAYEWLSGRRPFEGTADELINQHLRVPPPPLRTFVPELPEGVERVILKALSKDPKERFPSIQAFADALAQASKEQFEALTVTDEQVFQPQQPRTAASPASITPVMLAAASDDDPMLTIKVADLLRKSSPQISLPSAPGPVSEAGSLTSEVLRVQKREPRRRLFLALSAGIVLVVLFSGTLAAYLLKLPPFAVSKPVKTLIVNDSLSRLASSRKDGMYSWDHVADGSICYFGQDGYHIVVPAKQSSSSQCRGAVPLPNSAFVALDMDMRILRGHTGMVGLRLDDKGNYVVLELDNLGRYYDGSQFVPSPDIHAHASNTISMVLDNGHLFFYVNHGKYPLKSLVYTRTAATQPIVRASAADTDTEVLFQNLIVYDLKASPKAPVAKDSLTSSSQHRLDQTYAWEQAPAGTLCYFAQDGYHVVASGAQSFVSSCHKSTPLPTDGQLKIDIDMQILKGHAGLVGIDAGDLSDDLGLEISADGTYRAVNGFEKSSDIHAHAVNTITIETTGTRLLFYVNHSKHPLKSVPYVLKQGARFIVQAAPDGQDTNVLFRNIKIYRIV